MLRYRFQYYVLLLICVVALAACDRMPPVDPYAPSVISDWPLPAQQWNSDLPGLALTPDGRLLLSWINNQQGRRTALQFSAYSPARQHWLNRPTTIAVGNNLDDFMVPRMISHGGILWATWGQKSETDFRSDIVVSHSRNGGATWSPPQTPYNVNSNATNFSSELWPDREWKIGISWMVRDMDSLQYHLYATSMDAAGQRSAEVILDLRLCGSGVAQTSRGPLLAWSSRTGASSILVARHNADGWGVPVRIHTAPCTDVKLAAHNKTAIVAWGDDWEDDEVDADNSKSLIRMAHSGDAGDTFAESVEIVRGRWVFPLAVALDAQQAWVLWEQQDTADMLSLWFARLSTDLRTEYERREIVSINAPEADPDYISSNIRYVKNLDFVLSKGAGYLVWVQKHDRGSALHGVTIQPGAAAGP